MHSLDHFDNDLIDYGPLFDNIEPAGDGLPLFDFTEQDAHKALDTAKINLDAAKKPKKKDRTWVEWYADDFAVPVGTVIGGVISTGLYGEPLSGAAIGAKTGDMVRSAFGSGQYKIGPMKPGYNTLANANQIPKFKTKGGSNIIAHREYIGDVTTSGTLVNGLTDFSLQTFPIQPGLARTFPWANQLAQQYEEYIIHGCIFEYKSSSGDGLNSTNTALGTVVMGTQYNVNSQTFQTKQQMENYEYTNSCRPSEYMLHAVECAPSEQPYKMLFTRGGSVTSTNASPVEDRRLYDHANFSIATQGMQQTNQIVGELWVTYQIELLKPKIAPGAITEVHHLFGINAGGGSPFGTAVTLSSGPLNALVSVDGRTLSWDAIPGAIYMVVYTACGTATTTGAVVVDQFTNCASFNKLIGPNATANPTFNNRGFILFGSGGGFTVTAWQQTVKANNSLSSGRVSIGISGSFALPISANCDIWVVPLNGTT